jgi:hypothetical protein
VALLVPLLDLMCQRSWRGEGGTRGSRRAATAAPRRGSAAARTLVMRGGRSATACHLKSSECFIVVDTSTLLTISSARLEELVGELV